MSHTERTWAAYPTATVTGYPRIGPNRELKRALEALWSGKISPAEFETVARSLRLETSIGKSTLPLLAAPMTARPLK